LSSKGTPWNFSGFLESFRANYFIDNPRHDCPIAKMLEHAFYNFFDDHKNIPNNSIFPVNKEFKKDPNPWGA
jgi:hypothetical protein